MKEEYKRIRRELFAHSPRFKKLQSKIFFRFAIKVILLELLIAAFAVGAFSLAPTSVYAFIIIGIAVLYYLTKASKLIGTRVLGTVTDINRITRNVTRSGMNQRGGTFRMTQNTFSVFTISSDDGNTQEIELNVQYEKVFKKGDRIIRLSGMKHPVDLTPEELLICPFCGNIFPTENQDCIECGEPALNARAIQNIER